MKKLLLICALIFSINTQAAVPNIFATMPSGNVAASTLDANFAYILNGGPFAAISNSGGYTQTGTAANTFTGSVTIPNAATATQAVALGQGDGRYSPISYSQKIVITGNYTLTAADSGKYLDVWTSAPAGTVITTPVGANFPLNFSITIGPNNSALTITSGISGVAAVFNPDGSVLLSAGASYNKPVGDGNTLYLHEWGGGNASASYIGRTVVANAVNPNEAVALGQLYTSAGKAGVAVTVGASPFAYTAGTGGSVAISGGTVANLALARGGVTVWNTSLSSDVVPVRAGDIVTITYTTAPAVYFLGN